MDKLLLKFMREAGAETLEINRFSVFEFRLKEKLMAFFVRKANNLRFNGWAISWSHSFDNTVEDSGLRKMFLNQFDGGFRGIDEIARKLILKRGELVS
jgi:hypothetical protein